MISLEAEASVRGRIRVASLRGDLDIKLHRHGAVVVHATGVKVDLGAQAQVRADGWRDAQFGEAAADAASLELRSKFGNVVFAIIE
jgi:hypothetical protein